MIFNNGEYLSEHTSQSYVMEIDPYLDASGNDTGHYVNPPDAGYNTLVSPAVTDKTPKLISKQVVWNYYTESNLTLYSQIGCGAQRLPNGNTLITADTYGYIMEVTPTGETVWDYIVPVTNGGTVLTLGDRLPMINSIFRAYRYDESYSAFAGRTLTPGATVAGRTTVANPYAGTAHYDALQRQTETQYWDATNAYNGYTFFGAQGTSYLVDMQGRKVNTWATGTDPRLLDSGNVLDWATNTSGQTGLKELDWNGNTVWQYYETRTAYHPHGDFQRIYDPKLGAYATLYLANKDVTAAECIAAGCDPADAPYDGAQVDTIVEVDMSGNIVWEWSFWDHAIQDVDATKANYVGTGKTIADYPGKINLNLPGRPLRANWLDCNSLDYNQSLDQIVVNSRQGEFYIIDHGNTFLAGNPTGSIALAATTAGDFLYRFGDPARYSQGNPPSVSSQLGNGHQRQQADRRQQQRAVDRRRPARRRASAGVQQQPVPVPAHAAVLRVRDQSVLEFQRHRHGRVRQPAHRRLQHVDLRQGHDEGQPTAVQAGRVEVRFGQQPDAVQPLRLQRPAAGQRQHADLRHHRRLSGRGGCERQRGLGVHQPGHGCGDRHGDRRRPADDQRRAAGRALRRRLRRFRRTRPDAGRHDHRKRLAHDHGDDPHAHGAVGHGCRVGHQFDHRRRQHRRRHAHLRDWQRHTDHDHTVHRDDDVHGGQALDRHRSGECLDGHGHLLRDRAPKPTTAPATPAAWSTRAW